MRLEAPEQPHAARPGHVIIPPSRRTIGEIQADGRLSNGARRLAAYLDFRSQAYGKWAAWPKVSTIAADLGWGGNPRAFRKRVERYFRELIESGDVARPRLGELVDWYGCEGAARGLDWVIHRRCIGRDVAITVLGWKLAEAEKRLPSLTPCDIPVASNAPPGDLPAPPNVACDPPEMSHGDPPEMSHPQNVRNWNVAMERTFNVAALAPGGGGTSTADPDPVATVKALPAAVATSPPAVPTSGLSARRIAAYRLVSDLWRRDIRFSFNGQGGLAWKAGPGAVPPTEAERGEVRELMPEVVAELKDRGAWPATSPDPGSDRPADGQAVPKGKPAPKVPADVQAEVRHGLAGLRRPETTNPDVASTARKLAGALGPHKDKDRTLATFVKLCGEVRVGTLAESILLDAFERACGRKPECRGAVFIGAVKDLIAEGKRRGRPPADE